MQKLVRFPFLVALALALLIVALVGCDRRSEWDKKREFNEAMLAPKAPTDISVWCESRQPVTLQVYPYRDLEKQGCYIPPPNMVRNDEAGRIQCTAPPQAVTVVCEFPELSESDATQRWERFNAAVETYRRAKGQAK